MFGTSLATVTATCALAVVAGASGATVGATARGAARIRFATLVRANTQPTIRQDPVGTTDLIGLLRSGLGPQLWQLPQGERAKVDAIDWVNRFAFEAYTVTPTSGYSLTIKRITLQKITRTKRQFCVIAAITKPAAGTPVVARPTFATHVVTLSRKPYRVDPYHWNIPLAAVMRSTSGRLLAKGLFVGYDSTQQVYPPRPSLCRR